MIGYFAGLDASASVVEMVAVFAPAALLVATAQEAVSAVADVLFAALRRQVVEWFAVVLVQSPLFAAAERQQIFAAPLVAVAQLAAV